MRSSISKLKKTLPEFLSIIEYCHLTGFCKATVFNQMRRIPGLGVKLGWRTFIVRDIALAEMARAEEPQAWTPVKERTGSLEKDQAGEVQP
jgi:hypothetical protein